LFGSQSGTAGTRRLILRASGAAGLLFLSRALSVVYQLHFAENEFGMAYGGMIALLNQLTFYILLAELGLAAATTSLLFEPMHAGDSTLVKALVVALQRCVKRLLFWLVPLSAVAALGVALYLRRQLPFGTICFSLLLTAAAALLTFAALPYQSYLTAADMVPLRNCVLAIGFVTKVVLGVFLGKELHTIVGLPLAAFVVGIVELWLQYHLVVPRFRHLALREEQISDSEHEIRRRAKYVLFHRIGYLIGYQSDYVILLMTSALPLLAIYAQYQYIYAGALSFIISVGSSFTAQIARRQLSLGQGKWLPLYRTMLLYSAGIGVVCAFLYGIGTPFAVGLLYPHATKVGGGGLVWLFADLLMLNVLKVNDDLWIDTTGTYNIAYYLPMIEACSYIITGWVLVRHFGLPGLVFAALITNLVFSVGCKAFVIGRGIVKHSSLRIYGLKIANVVAMIIALAVLEALMRSV
jgi:hypothetical protein